MRGQGFELVRRRDERQAGELGDLGGELLGGQALDTFRTMQDEHFADVAAGTGAFGLAVGFGLQKTFGNLISGIILLMDRSIKPGDVIAVNDGTNSVVGQVTRIGIRAVSVVTRDKKEFLIPNENLMINQVENWSYSSRDVRIRVPVGLGYASDIDLAERLVVEAALDTPRVMPFPAPQMLLIGFGDNGLLCEVRLWVDDPEEGIGNVRSDLLKRVLRRFREHGIQLPHPQRDLHIRDWPGKLS